MEKQKGGIHGEDHRKQKRKKRKKDERNASSSQRPHNFCPTWNGGPNLIEREKLNKEGVVDGVAALVEPAEELWAAALIWARS